MDISCFFGFHKWKFKYISDDSCEGQVYCKKCRKVARPAKVVHNWQSRYINDDTCKKQNFCKRCGKSQDAITEIHDWIWEERTPCLKIYKCKHCGIKRSVNEKDHIWELSFIETNSFVRKRVCKNCGIQQGEDYTGSQQWACISTHEQKRQKFFQLHKAIGDLKSSQKIWNCIEKRTPYYDSGRTELSIISSILEFTNIPIYALQILGSECPPYSSKRIQTIVGYLVFYPDRVSFVDRIIKKNRVSLIDRIINKIPAQVIYSAKYQDLHIETSTQLYQERDIRPGDAEVQYYTWEHQRVDGGPDRRYSQNMQLPTYKYCKVIFSAYGKGWQFLISNVAIGLAFGTALSEYISEWNEQEFRKSSEEKKSEKKQSKSERDSSSEERKNPNEGSREVPSSKYGKTPFEILGVKPNASPEEITEAYRKKALENHPDRVSGLDEEFRELAERKMKIINAAYDELKRKF